MVAVLLIVTVVVGQSGQAAELTLIATCAQFKVEFFSYFFIFLWSLLSHLQTHSDKNVSLYSTSKILANHDISYC